MNTDTILKTVLISFVAAGGAFFGASWDNGFIDATRASGGAFFATAGILLVYLKVDPRTSTPEPQPGIGTPAIGNVFFHDDGTFTDTNGVTWKPTGMKPVL